MSTSKALIEWDNFSKSLIEWDHFSKVLIEWRHTVLSLPSVDTLYNYTERETPKEFSPDARLTAFHIYTTKRSPKPRIQPQHNNSVKDGHSCAIEYHDARRRVKHVWDSDILGLRLNHQGSAWFKWDDNKSRFCDLLQNKPRFAKAISDPNSHPTGVAPLWVLRSFFIGPNTTRCPPYITVMCSDERLSRHLVDYIRDKLQSPEMEYLNDWGVTRLPNVHVSEFGSPAGSSSSSPEELPPQEEEDKSAQGITVHLPEKGLPVTIPNDMARASWDKQQHRCGIKLNIFEDSRVRAHTTIGGLIQVAETIFGLTVSHIFPKESSAQQPGVEGKQDPITAPTNQESEATMDSSSTITGRWRNPLRQNMVFDWALVEMPSLESYNQRPDTWEDVNLVETISGDFRPVLVVPEIPVSGTPVVLATPGSALCLRGIVTGEDALVNMPDSPSSYITWVLRMEQPWLIRPGDSGSWAFDAGNGDLLGILVAGCPELHEAYVIPAHQLFGYISTVVGKDVRLPNSYPITQQDHHALTRLEKTFLGFKADLEFMEAKKHDISALDLERIEIGVAACFAQAQAVFPKDSQGPLNYRVTGSRWRSTSKLLSQISTRMKRYEHDSQWLRTRSMSLTSDDRDLCEDILRQSPLECFNFLLNKLRDDTFQSYWGDHNIAVPEILWVHLILGEGSLKFSEKDVSTAGYHTPQVVHDERRSCANYSMVDLPRDRSSIMDAFVSINQELGRIIHLEKEYCYATIPGEAPFSKSSITAFPVIQYGVPFGANLEMRKDLEHVNNPIFLVAVLLNESKNQILVLDPSRDIYGHFWIWKLLALPCIQVDESLDEKQNLELLLSSKMGLENMSYDQAEKLELSARDSRFWLKDHNMYLDVTAFKVILSDEDWKSIPSQLYKMHVTGLDLKYAPDRVNGWHYVRILQFLGYDSIYSFFR